MAAGIAETPNGLHHFIGASRNAVTLQIIAAIFAHLLVRLAQLQSRSSLAAQAAFRLSCLTLFQRRPLHDQPAPKPDPPCPQLTLTIPHG